MLFHSRYVILATNGEKIHWEKQHAAWLKEYEIPVETERVLDVDHRRNQVCALRFAGEREVKIDNIFTTRGDIFHTGLAEKLGAKLDGHGQIEVDQCMRTSVPRLYAAGCVTP